MLMLCSRIKFHIANARKEAIVGGGWKSFLQKHPSRATLSGFVERGDVETFGICVWQSRSKSFQRVHVVPATY
jgi:hypothetical protein